MSLTVVPPTSTNATIWLSPAGMVYGPEDAIACQLPTVVPVVERSVPSMYCIFSALVNPSAMTVLLMQLAQPFIPRGQMGRMPSAVVSGFARQ